MHRLRVWPARSCNHISGSWPRQNASLVSSGGEAAKRDDAPDTVRIQATLDMNLQSLRAVLYQLESGTPYVFVDALAVQPINATAGRSVEDRFCGPL